MAHGILLVLSEPVSTADDAAYNDWYDHIHLPEVLALPGFNSARRYRMSEVQLPSQGGLESVTAGSRAGTWPPTRWKDRTSRPRPRR